MNEVTAARVNPQRTLLVVDDQDNVRSSVAYYLEVCGYRTFRAESGLAAIELVRTEQIDGVLLDVQMPGLNGFETCARLLALAHEAGRPLKVWLMTGAFYREMEATCQKAGALAIFKKPFDWPELLAELERGLPLPPAAPENAPAASN